MSQLIHFREGDDLFIQDVADLPFKLLGNLGSGHSGIVEKVEDMTTGAVFARKTIYIRGKRDKIATQNIFRNEIGIIRGLSKHHHMIRVFATYMAKREVGLLLQPVADGGDLAQFLEQVEEIRLADTSDVRLVSYMAVLDRAFGCLASGLAFMHQQKIRHKDIKPQNILVHEGSVIYTDFGYSLDSAHLSRSTTEGQPDALTRRYSAPEVLERGERNSSSDVFSLGCVYLELLAIKSGKPFFVPHEKTFAEDMEHIHGRLRSAETETHLSLLYQTTVSMTVARRKDRATASHVLEALSGTPRYCCATCRAMESTSKTVQSAHTEILNVKTRTMRPNAPTKRHSIATSTSPSEQFSNNGTERSRSGTRPPRAILRSQSHDPSGTHIRSIWSDQYNQMYREKHDNSLGWVFFDWGISGQRSTPTLSGHENGHFYAPPHSAFSMQSKAFYAPGRVFSIPAAQGLVRTVSDLGTSAIGGATHLQPAYLIVVRRMSQSCLAVPVFLEEQFERCIPPPGECTVAYSSGSCPESFVIETGLLEMPVCIEQAYPFTSLEPSSRIWFRLQYEIPYDVLVKRVGQVHRSSFLTFISYCDVNQSIQLSRDQAPRQNSTRYTNEIEFYEKPFKEESNGTDTVREKSGQELVVFDNTRESTYPRQQLYPPSPKPGPLSQMINDVIAMPGRGGSRSPRHRKKPTTKTTRGAPSRFFAWVISPPNR